MGFTYIINRYYGYKVKGRRATIDDKIRDIRSKNQVIGCVSLHGEHIVFLYSKEMKCEDHSYSTTHPAQFDEYCKSVNDDENPEDKINIYSLFTAENEHKYDYTSKCPTCRQQLSFQTQIQQLWNRLSPEEQQAYTRDKIESAKKSIIDSGLVNTELKWFEIARCIG